MSPPAAPAPRAAADAAATELKAVEPAALKNAFLEEVRKSKKYFYGTVVAQAQRIDLESDRFVFVFAPHQRSLRVQLEQTRAWLEATASQLAGRKMAIA